MVIVTLFVVRQPVVLLMDRDHLTCLDDRQPGHSSTVMRIRVWQRDSFLQTEKINQHIYQQTH